MCVSERELFLIDVINQRLMVGRRARIKAVERERKRERETN